MNKSIYLLVLFVIVFQNHTVANIVSGKISDISDDLPVGGVYIYLYETEFIDSTDANGEFTIENVPIGTYTIIIDHPDYVQKVVKNFEVTDGTNSIEINDGYNLSVRSYPNPFIDNLSIEFSVNEPQNIVIEILDLQGRVLEVVENKQFEQGEHITVWNGAISGQGSVYFYRIRGNNFMRTEKIIKIN